jgi:glutamate synthase (NADPH/NADH) small chain
VAVVGGGNTALDAIRSALRLGAAEASVIYRRSASEMPARAEEVRHAREEGVRFLELTHPIELLGDEAGWLRAARCVRMRLGAPDGSGRPRPCPIAGSEHDVPLDVAIIAIGTGPNPLVQGSAPDLKTDAHGHIDADPETLRTSREGVFAGGDVVTGSATVILAMAAGRRGAASIDRYLRAEPR